MRIVTVSVAVRSDEDAEQLAEELFNDVRAMYSEADDDVTPLAADIRKPTMQDLQLVAERRGEDDIEEPATPEATPIPPALLDGHRKNFNTLRRAWRDGALALVSAIRTDAARTPVALICAMQRNPDKTITPVPFAEMVNGNPFELYHDPTVLPAIKDGPAAVEKTPGGKRRKGQ